MTVVVGVDGSPPSRTALRLAAQEARCRQVPLIAVSAYEPPLGKPAGGYPIGTMHTGDDERATTESALRDAVSKELGEQADQRTCGCPRDWPATSSSRRRGRRTPS